MSTAASTALPPGWTTTDLADAPAIIARAAQLYHPRLSLASSFSLEDAVLIDLLAKTTPQPRIFALDTGRLDPETYECAEALRLRYRVTIDWFFPRHEAVEKLEREKGLFSFRESVANRKECCRLRKVEPLGRALAGLAAWITGLRREQHSTRAALEPVELDTAHGGLVQINPLTHWTTEQLWAYARENRIPYNRLYDQGYASIGCAPCTRAIQPGQDLRSGRWWWENPEHKECGLHPRNKA